MSDTDPRRPLLLLDVDGPLNPFAARLNQRPWGYSTYYFRPPSWVAHQRARGVRDTGTLRVRLKAAHGTKLRALPYELVWATAWGVDANAYIGPVLGLPELPVIEWPDGFRSGTDGLLWKTRRVVEWAEGRPFAWVDDAITERERSFVARHHTGPALLHQVSPRKGMRRADFAALAAWAERRSEP